MVVLARGFSGELKRGLQTASRAALRAGLCGLFLITAARLLRELPRDEETSPHRIALPQPVLVQPPSAASRARLDRVVDRVHRPFPRDPFGSDMRDGLVITGATPHRLILFTFDDGPDRQTTPRLLEHLDRTGVKAVFFLTAERIGGANRTERAQGEIARDIVRRGHMVGSHTVHHAALPSLNDADVLAELEGAEKIFERVLGKRPWLLRPPYGGRSERVDFLIASRGYTQMVWNLGTGDFLARDENEVLDLFQKKLAIRERDDGQHGGIILLHDTHPWSVAAYLLIHADLMARNCALLERGEELYDVVDDPRLFYVERAGADPSLESPALELPPELLAARQERLRERTAVRCRSLAAR